MDVCNLLGLAKSILIYTAIGIGITIGLNITINGCSSEDSSIPTSSLTKNTENATLTDSLLISEWYNIVLKDGEMSDAILDKYLSPEAKKKIWTEDYDGCYQYWAFRTAAQDYNISVGDISKIEEISDNGDGWYEVKYIDMGFNGKTLVKIENNQIVDLVKDASWDSWDSQSGTEEEKTEIKNDLDWLQGHWVYEQGNYKGHFVIQGNTLSMYSTMNPDPLTYTYRVDGNELFAGEMTVKLDLANKRIDYGENSWMYKVE